MRGLDGNFDPIEFLQQLVGDFYSFTNDANPDDLLKCSN